MLHNNAPVPGKGPQSNGYNGHAGQLHLRIRQSIFVHVDGPLHAGTFDNFFRVDAGKSRRQGNAQCCQNARCCIAGSIRATLIGGPGFEIAQHDSCRQEDQRNDLQVFQVLAQNGDREQCRGEQLGLHQHTKHGGIEIGQGDIFHARLKVVRRRGDKEQQRVAHVLLEVLKNALDGFSLNEQNVTHAESEFEALAAQYGGRSQEFGLILHDGTHNEVLGAVLNGANHQNQQPNLSDGAWWGFAGDHPIVLTVTHCSIFDFAHGWASVGDGS
mmetsp:Transcript_28703/g.78858  ORF Transcript_28703/g.78858 Transcript_28703/m.78858 type:complete len:271 (-) Transcript_28703:203-1015(-)